LHRTSIRVVSETARFQYRDLGKLGGRAPACRAWGMVRR
jgi:hypothetical protein